MKRNAVRSKRTLSSSNFARLKSSEAFSRICTTVEIRTKTIIEKIA